jgi:hypothetical protein
LAGIGVRGIEGPKSAGGAAITVQPVASAFDGDYPDHGKHDEHPDDGNGNESSHIFDWLAA